MSDAKSVISTLVMLKYPTNTGYAISSLERLFYYSALDLADGDPGRVHFTYPSLAGAPQCLPPEFQQYLTFDTADASPANLAALTQLCRERKIDLAITFDMQPVHPVYAALRRGGARKIVSYWGGPISGLSPWWKLAIKRALIALSRSRADGLIFESQSMARYATHGRGVPAAMIDVVPLGVDVDKFKPADSDYAYRALDLPRERRIVIFTGHCSPRKGIGTLVDAAIELLQIRRRTDLVFLICGNRNDESRQYEVRYQDLDIASWIRFLGYRTDVRELLQSAFCGVLPSTGWDSFTMSSVEMAATGLPIIASRLEGLEEAVVHEQTGLLFEPGNTRALADSIERLANDPERARQLGRNGRTRCERELSTIVQQRRFVAALRRHFDAS
jgi:glycosyltransferase involved in cell wall biosynthesis